MLTMHYFLCANKKTLVQLYQRPVLEYRAVAFTEKNQFATDKLGKAERKCLRIAVSAPIKTSTTWLYQEAGIESIHKRLTRLRNNSINRFNKNSKIMQDLSDLGKMTGAVPVTNQV